MADQIDWDMVRPYFDQQLRKAFPHAPSPDLAWSKFKPWFQKLIDLHGWPVGEQVLVDGVAVPGDEYLLRAAVGQSLWNMAWPLEPYWMDFRLNLYGEP